MEHPLTCGAVIYLSLLTITSINNKINDLTSIFITIYCAVGCILSEMLGRKPLFPGRDFIHTLNLVCKVIGSPSREDICAFPSDKAQKYLDTMPFQPKVSFQQLFPEADSRAVDLLDRLLTFKYVLCILFFSIQFIN